MWLPVRSLLLSEAANVAAHLSFWFVRSTPLSPLRGMLFLRAAPPCKKSVNGVNTISATHKSHLDKFRYPEHADEILEHIRQAHSDYVGSNSDFWNCCLMIEMCISGCSSAGTIVRVPWHVAGNREMTQAEIINAFERHLDKVNKRIEIMLAGQG